MLGAMTLSERNYLFRGMIIIAALSLLLTITGGYLAYPSFPAAASSAAFRAGGAIQKFFGRYAAPSAYAPFWTMMGAVAYSFASITLIYFFFEKTQSPEIIFFGFFAFSLSFEAARIIIPLRVPFSFPAMYLTIAAQVLLFGRYFGLFSLFAASVYAAGFDSQKQRNIFFMLILSALVIALTVPVDGLVWDSTFKLLSGYGPMFAIVEAGIAAATIITFLISAFTRGSRTYILIGLGTLMAYAGRNMLLNADTWVIPAAGILFLGLGTWLICSRLHKEYLWL